MMEALHEPFFQRAVLATLFAGAACSVVGVLVVTMRLSFLGVCMSHAAFAGALLGAVLGWPPMSMALVLSLVAAASLGPLADRGRLAPDAATGIVFSSFLGVSFLLLALVPGPKSEALGLLWGSVLTATNSGVYVLAAVAVAMALGAWLFFKEIQTVIFSRELAVSLGLPATAVFYGILVASGLTATASLQSIGGLLVFSLMVNPAAAAYQLTYSLRRMFLLSVLFGVASGWIGLALSWAFNLPTGALIALVSCGFFAAASLVSPKRRGQRSRHIKTELQDV
jgi:manganese/iron transport system permease protein